MSRQPSGHPRRRTPGVEELLKVIGPASRREVLFALLRHSDTVSALAARLGLGIPHVSRDLQQLAGVGLVAYRQEGQFKHYTVTAAAQVDRAHGLVIVTLRAPAGGAVALHLTPDDLADLDWEHALTSEVVTKVFGTPAPTGSAPKSIHPPNGHARG